MEPSYYQNGTLIKRITGEKVERINETDLVVFQTRPNNLKVSSWARTLGLLLLPLVSAIKKYFYQHQCLFFDSRITPAAQLGLWTLRPRFLSGFALF